MDRVEELRQAWDERARDLGLTKRAVLFKRFPGWLNESVHRRHAAFALRNVPAHASRVLDVGCGFGRMSEALGHAVTHEASSMGFLPGIPVPALYHGLAIGAAAGEG